MMALALAEDSISKRERRDTIIDELGQLPGKVRKALLLDGAMRKLAESTKNTNSLLFFGRGYNYSTSLEAALKVIFEVSSNVSQSAYGLACLQVHGPVGAIDCVEQSSIQMLDLKYLNFVVSMFH